VIGIDDAPFARAERGDVRLVGAVFARTRLDGVVIGAARRDGSNSTSKITKMIQGCTFVEHVQAVVLQGITVAGFNVIDIHELSQRLERPVLVVARRAPNFEKIRRALLDFVPGGAKKWTLIERAGPMEAVGGVFVQRAGLDLAQAARLLRNTTLHGGLPEPLRVAHLIAGALATGQSRGRA